MSAAAAMAISVVIPCYNAAAFLPEALDSVLSQSHPAHDIVVVDDGSTDNTADVARRYGETIRYIAQENGGIGAARNTGAAAALGDWITFFDADDLMTADSLRRRIETFTLHPNAEVVFGLTDHFVTVPHGAPAAPTWACPPGAQAVRLSGACLMRRSAFDRVGGFRTDLACGEMIDWFARANDAGVVVVQIDNVVLRRRIHGTNTTILAKESRRDYLRVLRASLDRRRATSPSTAT